MQRDMQRVQTLLKRIITPGMDYPIINFDTFLAKEVRLIAPLKVDIPLAPPDMLVPLIDKLWEVGIPNMMLLLPENPDHTHIIRAIERAEDLGMIAGVRGRGTDIQQGSLLHDMAQAGVDYITVLYQSVDATIHDALCGTGDHAAAERMLDAIHAHEVCPVVELAVVELTMDTIHETVSMLTERRIQTISFFMIAYFMEQIAAAEGSGILPSQAMPQVERLVEEFAADYPIQAILQPIGIFDSAASLASQVRLGPRCSGNVSVRVEPTGEIISAQGPYRSVGNILTDPWEWLWADEMFYEFRERVSSWDDEDDVEVPEA
jgi:MoaA/NifB/PqqE/SkfB family radical SAM enzyme